MKKIFSFSFLLASVWIVWKIFFSSLHDGRSSFPEKPMELSVIVSGEELFFRDVAPGTVEDFLARAGFSRKDADWIFPRQETKLAPGMRIYFTPARSVTLNADGKERKVETTDRTAGQILATENIALDEDDIVVPEREATVSDGGIISVTRVLIQEETKDAPIPFATKTKEDDSLSWRKKVVDVPGVNGVKRTTYRVSYHDGQEVNRRILSTERIQEPVDEVVTQGTYVKLGKSHTGGASWYAFTGTLSAANPWLPLGSYVKVTNTANGKSVIVKINDRGPFVGGRIIDLDKVAFEEIASIGAGVINVKMEEIVN